MLRIICFGNVVCLFFVVFVMSNLNTTTGYEVFASSSQFLQQCSSTITVAQTSSTYLFVQEVKGHLTQGLSQIKVIPFKKMKSIRTFKFFLKRHPYNLQTAVCNIKQEANIHSHSLFTTVQHYGWYLPAGRNV